MTDTFVERISDWLMLRSDGAYMIRLHVTLKTNARTSIVEFVIIIITNREKLYRT